MERDESQSAGFSKRKTHQGTQDSTIKSRPPGFSTRQASSKARRAFSQLDRQSVLVRWWISITIKTMSNFPSRSGKAKALPWISRQFCGKYLATTSGGKSPRNKSIAVIDLTPEVS